MRQETSASLRRVVNFINNLSSELSKNEIQVKVQDKFELTKDRSVFYNKEFAIRFSKANSQNFGNTVLSLSALMKFDDKPLVVCICAPTQRYFLLANTTFIKKISHSSRDLTVSNIRGSFNGSDIARDLDGVTNSPKNFDFLYSIHESITPEENLERLVEATNSIESKKIKFDPSDKELELIRESPIRANSFVTSRYFEELHEDLQNRIQEMENEILLASLIENVNIRGNLIEYLITGKDEEYRKSIISALRNQKAIPHFKTDNDLGDYKKEYENFSTATDIKTKVLTLNSNPKAFNIDKLLEFLASENSVFMFLLVGLSDETPIQSKLVSVFDSRLIKGINLIHHWAGRNSRGVAQFNGQSLQKILINNSFQTKVNQSESIALIDKLLNPFTDS